MLQRPFRFAPNPHRAQATSQNEHRPIQKIENGGKRTIEIKICGGINLTKTHTHTRSTPDKSVRHGAKLIKFDKNGKPTTNEFIINWQTLNLFECKYALLAEYGRNASTCEKKSFFRSRAHSNAHTNSTQAGNKNR